MYPWWTIFWSAVCELIHVKMCSVIVFFFLPVNRSRSSISSGAGFILCSPTHIFLIFLVREDRRPWRAEASTLSSRSFLTTSYQYRKCVRSMMIWLNITQRRRTGKKWDLQISALPRQTAFKCVEILEVEVFCWVWIQSVWVPGQVAGVAFGLYQCRETGTIQSLFKSLEKLEQSPENKWEMKVERELSWQQDMNCKKN